MDETEFQEIGKYLRGELNEEEEENFIGRMKTDKVFAEKVRLEKEVMRAFTDTQIPDFRRMVEEIKPKSEANKEKNTRIFSLTHIRYIAAAVIVSLLISLPFIFEFNNKPLFDQYYTSYSAENIRTDDNSISDNLKQGLDDYKKQNYTGALERFEEESENNPNEILAHFLTGHCHLHFADMQSAIASFGKVVDHRNNRYYHQAKWFLALSYLKNEDIIKAKSLLNEIIDSNSGYKRKAQELLQKLD